MIFGMYGLLFINYLLMGFYIGSFLLEKRYTDLLLAVVHFFIGIGMHDGIEQAKEEDSDDDF